MKEGQKVNFRYSTYFGEIVEGSGILKSRTVVGTSDAWYVDAGQSSANGSYHKIMARHIWPEKSEN